MPTTVQRQCAVSRCRRRPVYVEPGHDYPSLCANHRPDACRVPDGKCQAEDCNRRASYGFQRPTHCVAHKEVEMSDRRHRLCANADPPCLRQASYGWENDRAVSGKPTFCRSHKQAGMVDVRNHAHCAREGCRKRPSHAFEGEKARLCAAHRELGMMDVSGKPCEVEGCTVTPKFGFPGQGVRVCGLHRFGDMINVKDRTCEHETCPLQPSFALPGEKPRRCSLHQEEGMVNVRHKRCRAPGCALLPSYADEGTRIAVYCATHKTENMGNVKESKTRKRKFMFLGSSSSSRRRPRMPCLLSSGDRYRMRLDTPVGLSLPTARHHAVTSAASAVFAAVSDLIPPTTPDSTTAALSYGYDIRLLTGAIPVNDKLMFQGTMASSGRSAPELFSGCALPLLRVLPGSTSNGCEGESGVVTPGTMPGDTGGEAGLSTGEVPSSLLIDPEGAGRVGSRNCRVDTAEHCGKPSTPVADSGVITYLEPIATGIKAMGGLQAQDDSQHIRDGLAARRREVQEGDRLNEDSVMDMQRDTVMGSSFVDASKELVGREHIDDSGDDGSDDNEEESNGQQDRGYYGLETMGDANGILRSKCLQCDKAMGAEDQHLLFPCGHGLFHKACSAPLVGIGTAGGGRPCPRCQKAVYSYLQILV